MRPPARRPVRERRPAPAPLRRHSGQRHVGFVARACARLGDWLCPTRVGRVLRGRLTRALRASRIEVPLGRGGAGLQGLRIAFLSDLHAGFFMDESDLEHLFAAVAAERPDLVCLGGDLVDARAEQMLLYRRPLQQLDPPLGVFAVPGNHEHAVEPDLKLFQGVLSEAGVRVLLNEGQRVERDGATLWVAGVDDHGLGQPDIGLGLHGVRDDEPVVLLSHHPDFFWEAASVGVDLTLAGHTHGGQILFAGRTPCRHTVLGYWQGLFALEGAQLFVSRGAGVTLLPLRVGAAPEIAVLTLRMG